MDGLQQQLQRTLRMHVYAGGTDNPGSRANMTSAPSFTNSAFPDLDLDVADLGGTMDGRPPHLRTAGQFTKHIVGLLPLALTGLSCS